MSRTRRDIEDILLYPYDARKLEADGLEYHLIIPYEKESELDKIVNDLLDEMESFADGRNCHTEAIIKDRNSDRRWD